MRAGLDRGLRGVVRWPVVVVVAIALRAVGTSGAFGAEIRTWSDSTGRYKIKAKFVESADGKVTLEREDGTQAMIPLNKLSEADQKVVSEMQSDDQNPFQTVKPARKPARKSRARPEPQEEPSAGDSESGGGPKVVTPQWSGVKEILPAARGEKWSLSIEAPQAAALPGERRAIAIPAKADFGERAKAMVVNPVCRRAVIGYEVGKPGGGDQTRLLLVDLAQAKVLGTGVGSGKMIPLALNDGGSRVVLRTDEFGQGKLDIWALSPSGVKKELRWTPGDEQKRHGGEIKWAAYVDKEKLVTASSDGRLTIWEASAGQPICTMKIQNNCHPALSPDRKYLAFATEKEIGILDLAAEEVVAMQAVPKPLFPSGAFAFTPKGLRLVCGCMDRFYVWDTATGALYREIAMAGAVPQVGDNLMCPSEDHVLVGNSLGHPLMGNSVLVDIESQVKLWSYGGYQMAAAVDGVCWFALTDREPCGLVPSKLPHPAAQDQIQKAMESPDLFVIKPGATVKINATAIPDAAERDRAISALTQRLQANGCQIGANAAVEVVASVEMGKRGDHTYGNMMGPRFGPFASGGKTYTVQEYLSKVKVLYQGQPVWESACTSLPHIIHLKNGETLEQFLRNSEHPNYAWFGTVEIPKVLQKSTPGAMTIGTTQVTVAGVR